MKEKYNPKEIEYIVQNYWDKKNIFKVTEKKDKKKYYCLTMLPYPSGKLHMGHVRNYTIGDVIARYQRMLGKNVLHPIGWDAFGLPAENAALKNNCTPSSWTYKNIQYMKTQLKMLGLSYDWDREITTCHPNYYKWEQWIFLKLYKKGLAYKKKSNVNWCTEDNTVLANEQVINGRCWRCFNKVIQKKISQWFLKITDYNEELLKGLKHLNKWPKKVLKMQKNWIGKSEGLEIDFKILNTDDKITVYTTRPDTLIRVTYLMIGPNHPIINKLKILNSEILNLISSFKNQKFNIKNLVGINTNIIACHPITNTYLSIWISNVVLEEYGTGAVMSAPEDNQIDLNFAKKYNLPIKSLISTKIDQKSFNDNAYKMIKKDFLFNFEKFNRSSNEKKIDIITKYLEEKNIGRKKIYFRLKDWCISRQRYWGTPIPILYGKNKKIIPISEDKLPIILSENIKVEDIKNLKTKKSFWSKSIAFNSKMKKENDTFDTFLESSWYYARYTCPNYSKNMLDINTTKYWLPVDQYIGGIEHATLHLIYFRFFHKILRDIGLVHCDEPVKSLLCQGMVLSNAFYYFNNKEKKWVSNKNIKIIRDKKGKILEAIDSKNRKLIYAGLHKMSKSKNNGVNPMHLIKKYGADSLRLFIMFAAPLEAVLEWQENGIKGMYRFLNRLWKLVFGHVKKGLVGNFKVKKLTEKQIILYEKLNTSIQIISEHIKRKTFNTAISNIMQITKIFIHASKETLEDRVLVEKALKSIVLMLSPFTPHISHILWYSLGEKRDLNYVSWPKKDSSIKLEKKFIEIIIQINGKVRTKILVLKNMTLEKIKKQVIIDSKIIKYIKNKNIKKIIYIPNKLINIVTTSKVL